MKARNGPELFFGGSLAAAFTPRGVERRNTRAQATRLNASLRQGATPANYVVGVAVIGAGAAVSLRASVASSVASRRTSE